MMDKIQNLYFERFGVDAQEVATEEIRLKVERIYKIDGTNVAYTWTLIDFIWTETFKTTLTLNGEQQ